MAIACKMRRSARIISRVLSRHCLGVNSDIIDQEFALVDEQVHATDKLDVALEVSLDHCDEGDGVSESHLEG